MQEVTGKMQYDIKTAFFQTSRFSYSGRIAAFSPQFPNSIFFFLIFILRPIDLHNYVF